MVRSTTLLVLLATSCSKPPSETAPPHVTESPPAHAEATGADAAPVPATPIAPAAEAAASGAPVATASGAPVAAASASAADASAGPPAKVKVISIGMHVAGGPFDEATKKPFLKAVEPRYPELARCWKHVTEPKQADAGVDLLIPTAGGRAKVSNPRSTIKADGFLPCVVAFFETVEFDPPKRGAPQGVSYSVRFKP